MKRLGWVVLALVVAAVFAFLAPVVPSRLYLCPPYAFCPACNLAPDLCPNAAVSLSYYAFGVGGRLIGGTYQVLFAPGWMCQPSRTVEGGYDCHQVIWTMPS